MQPTAIPEILQNYVLPWLDPADLLQCRLVCRSWRDNVDAGCERLIPLVVRRALGITEKFWAYYARLKQVARSARGTLSPYRDLFTVPPLSCRTGNIRYLVNGVVHGKWVAWAMDASHRVQIRERDAVPKEVETWNVSQAALMTFPDGSGLTFSSGYLNGFSSDWSDVKLNLTTFSHSGRMRGMARFNDTYIVVGEERDGDSEISLRTDCGRCPENGHFGVSFPFATDDEARHLWAVNTSASGGRLILRCKNSWWAICDVSLVDHVQSCLRPRLEVKDDFEQHTAFCQIGNSGYWLDTKEHELTVQPLNNDTIHTLSWPYASPVECEGWLSFDGTVELLIRTDQTTVWLTARNLAFDNLQIAWSVPCPIFKPCRVQALQTMPLIGIVEEKGVAIWPDSRTFHHRIMTFTTKVMDLLSDGRVRIWVLEAGGRVTRFDFGHPTRPPSRQ